MPIVFIAVLLAVIQFSLPERAQVPCAPRAELIAILQQRYDERAIGIGVVSTGAVLELWASRKGESWTIVVTLPSGQACVLAVGEAWQNLSASPRGERL